MPEQKHPARKLAISCVLLSVVLAGSAIIGVVRIVKHLPMAPSAQEAFEALIASPIPESITVLKSSYESHLKGERIAIYFEGSKTDVGSIIDTNSCWPAGLIAEVGWGREEVFDAMGVDTPNLEAAYFLRIQKDGSLEEYLISSDMRRVFFYHVKDADIKALAPTQPNLKE